ncbi:uncharacterized protein TNCV_691941 [Trichonephila clavipes]|nr:uncharacterized protein TNCV_691941 [Trichonephila clavipes]
MHFSRTKTVKVSPCHGLRKTWSVGIIRQSYGNFSNWISDLDCPFGDKSGTKFSRSKAFEKWDDMSKIWSVQGFLDTSISSY